MKVTASKTKLASHALGLLIAALACSGSPAFAQDPFESVETLDDFAAELEFFKVESDVVTSVSRTPESLWGAASAVYVITGEDIRKSGARTFPEALRMVPGLDVGSVDYNLSAVSARGFNNFFADKMLVLLDGRPIYTAEFGGVFWHQWNTFLPDVERIEVIRGPGGTLWGSNAVNGVINITTKSAEDTETAVLRVTAGDNSSLDVEARWGGHIDDFHYRVYGKQLTTDGYGRDGGDAQFDEADETRAGFRFDWELGKGLRLSGSGELYNGRLGATNNLPVSISPIATVPVDEGSKLKTDMYSGVVKLEKDFASGAQAYFQVALTYADRVFPFLGLQPNPAMGFAGDAMSAIRKSADLELGHNFRVSDRVRMTWGLTYQRTTVNFNDSALVRFEFDDGDDDTYDNVGAFIQNRVRLWEGGELTFGSKVEWNTFTDFNFQPSIRLAHRAGEDTTLWASISRAVNTPSFGDNYVSFTLPPDLTSIPGATVVPVFKGSESVDNTTLIAYEAGVRHRFNSDFAVDLAAFYNDYEDFAGWHGRMVEVAPTGPGSFDATSTVDNSADPYGYGVELLFDMIVNERVRAELNGSWQTIKYVGNRNPQVPEFKINFRPEFDLTDTLQFVPSVHWVDDVETPLPFTPTAGSTHLDSYLRLDTALHWTPGGHWPSFSFVVQNALDERHVEVQDLLVRPFQGEVTRAWYLRTSYEF